MSQVLKNAHQFHCSVKIFHLNGIETGETTCPFMAGKECSVLIFPLPKENPILNLTKQAAPTLFLTDSLWVTDRPMRWMVFLPSSQGQKQRPKMKASALNNLWQREHCVLKGITHYFRVDRVELNKHLTLFKLYSIHYWNVVIVLLWGVNKIMHVNQGEIPSFSEWQLLLLS